VLRVFANIAAAMQSVLPAEIKRRQVVSVGEYDPAYGAGVAKGLKFEPRREDRFRVAAKQIPLSRDRPDLKWCTKRPEANLLNSL
jgi:hypothetical protein